MRRACVCRELVLAVSVFMLTWSCKGNIVKIFGTVALTATPGKHRGEGYSYT